MDATLNNRDLESRLRRAYLRTYRRDRNTVLGFLFACTLLAFFFAYLLDRLTGFPAPVRVLVTVGIFGGIWFWLLRRQAKDLKKESDPERMARAVERRARNVRPGGLHSLVVSATEFGITGRSPGSAQLREQVLVRAREAGNNPNKLVLHLRKEETHTRNLLLVTIGVYALWAWLGLSSMLVFFARAVGLPVQYPTRTMIERVEAPETVARFENVHFEVEASGVLPAQGVVEVTYEDRGRTFDLPLDPVVEEPRRFTAMLERPPKGFRYRVKLGDARGLHRDVQVVAPPVVLQGELTQYAPDYAERTPLTRPLGSFQLWRGGTFDLRVMTDGQAATCELEIGGERIPLRREGDTFTASGLKAEESGPFSIRLVGEQGVENIRRPEYILSIREDQPPVVTLLAPDEGGYVAPPSRMRWRFQAEDDLGMTQAVLQATLISPEVLGDEGSVTQESKVLDTKEIPLANLEGATSLELDGVLQVDRLGAQPGNRIEIRVGVRDRNPDRTGEEGWSSPVTLQVVSGPELKKILAEELVGAHLMIQDIQEDMEAQRNAVRLRLKTNPDPGDSP